MNKKSKKIIAVVLSVAVINGAYKGLSRRMDVSYQDPFSIKKEEVNENLDNDFVPSTDTMTKKRKKFYRNPHFKKLDERW